MPKFSKSAFPPKVGDAIVGPVVRTARTPGEVGFTESARSFVNAAAIPA